MISDGTAMAATMAAMKGVAKVTWSPPSEAQARRHGGTKARRKGERRSHGATVRRRGERDGETGRRRDDGWGARCCRGRTARLAPAWHGPSPPLRSGLLGALGLLGGLSA